MKVSKIYIGCAIAVFLLLGATCFTYIYLNIPKDKIISSSERKESTLSVVPSLEDEITSNSAWCGTFNIVWNDLKNEIAKKDIILNEESVMANNLNKSTFNISYLSDDSYYKTYGYQTFELRDKIKKEIKEKFNEKSEIIDRFTWYEKTDTIFLYTMLKKEFEFTNPFDELKKSDFKNYSNVKYFGIDKKSDNKLREQVEVLYYNDWSEFAIKLLTKNNEEVIIVKNPSGKSFLEIYNNIIINNKKYTGNKALKDNEYLSVPNIKFYQNVGFKELEGKYFYTSNGEKYIIAKTLQTIDFSLDNKGGKLKSEAAISIEKSEVSTDESRYFYVNDTFAIFLKEKDKDIPYFASLISDIKEVQEQVKTKAN